MNQEEFDRLTKQSEETIKAKVICDSVNPDGVRLTTLECTYPRFIHAEIMTHRQLSRNSASSRAIPLKKMIERVSSNPVFPLHWGKNQKGMQAEQELDEEQRLNAAWQWLGARDAAISKASQLETIGIHKQLGNRLLEPWMWITVIMTATNWENLFALRCHPAAEPHFQNLAYKMRTAYDDSYPTKIPWGGWHLPYFGNNGGDEDDYKIRKVDYIQDAFAQISAGRCARVSYLTHDKKRDTAEDIRLFEQLSTHKPMHASPLEHPAQAVDPNKPNPASSPRGFVKDWGNFDPGWLQLRKQIQGECVRQRAN